jgi:hypothetical protein
MAAVAVNITAINADDVGTLKVWTAGSMAPLSPSLAVAGAGDAVGKLIVTVPSASGEIALQSTTGMDVLIDVVGWFRQAPAGSADGRYVRGPGTRIVDSTRSLATPGALPAGGRIDVPVAGVGAIPPDATAVALKVDLFESVPVGFVTVWASGPAPPGVSQLQVPPAGYTATNIVIVAPGEGTRSRSPRPQPRASLWTSSAGSPGRARRRPAKAFSFR